ncbi:hypothetical protein HDZ31DRAFT_65977 [Schizophyllum fasciatum]
MGRSIQELHAQGLFVNKSLDLVGMSILVYDYAITLGPEIETCRVINYIDSVCVAGIQVAVCAMMIRRVYAIYGHSRRVLCFLLVYLCVGVALSGWAIATQNGDFDFRKAKNGSGMSCLILYVPDSSVHRMSAVWIILMAFDLMVFLLTAHKTLEALRQPKMALSRVLLRDACLYFGLMALLNAANVITYYLATPYLRGCLGTVTNSLSVTLLSRMMLNLYKEANPRRHSAVELTTLVIAAVPSATLAAQAGTIPTAESPANRVSSS